MSVSSFIDSYGICNYKDKDEFNGVRWNSNYLHASFFVFTKQMPKIFYHPVNERNKIYKLYQYNDIIRTYNLLLIFILKEFADTIKLKHLIGMI